MSCATVIMPPSPVGTVWMSYLNLVPKSCSAATGPPPASAPSRRAANTLPPPLNDAIATSPLGNRTGSVMSVPTMPGLPGSAL